MASPTKTIWRTFTTRDLAIKYTTSSFVDLHNNGEDDKTKKLKLEKIGFIGDENRYSLSWSNGKLRYLVWCVIVDNKI
jgi:hypothetical protein